MATTFERVRDIIVEQLGVDADEVTMEANFRDVFSMFPLSLPQSNLFDLSFDLKARFSLSHWDSMLLAACKKAGVDTLYTEDLDAGTDYDGIIIVNPFA